MRYSNKKSKEKKQRRLQNLMAGEGVYIYENNTDADLSLPKPSIEGFKMIGPRKRFKGDSYFMNLVKTPVCLLRLIEKVEQEVSSTTIVEEIKNNEPEKNTNVIENKEKKVVKTLNKNSKKKKKAKIKTNIKDKKMKEKLLLDQPEVITKSGKVEQTEVEEQKENTQEEEKLLIENPSGNIEIISE